MCGYGGIAQKLVGIGNNLALSSTYGIAAGILERSDADRLFRLLVEEIHQTNGMASEAIYRDVSALLANGNERDALVELYSNVPKRSPWNATYADAGNFASLFARTSDTGDYLVMLVATLDILTSSTGSNPLLLYKVLLPGARWYNQKMLFITAHLPNDCYQTEIINQITFLANRLAGE